MLLFWFCLESPSPHIHIFWLIGFIHLLGDRPNITVVVRVQIIQMISSNKYHFLFISLLPFNPSILSTLFLATLYRKLISLVSGWTCLYFFLHINKYVDIFNLLFFPHWKIASWSILCNFLFIFSGLLRKPCHIIS